MRIKKIELIGFKSFAERTEIQLGEGATCVVGPNGCGKSNISDAIRWVFGERSAKLLRGSRMEDVIFNGTEFRKPTGMAEVSITIENADHRLAIDYDEVVLTRRLYRSGQSEYLLNRTPCRLRDILDLILDTGMGSNSYSMIEQGRVDSVIQADPEERRFLIEEAAGISKYKVKKEEALRKLERTEQNLLRIRDIVGEVQKNIQYAERQARRAERYKVQFEELKKHEIQKAFIELAEIAREKEMEGQKASAASQSLEILEKELKAILGRQQIQSRAIDEILKQEAAQAARVFETRSESRSVREKQQFNRERLAGIQHRQTEIKKELEILGANLTELGTELSKKAQEREEIIWQRKEAAEALSKEKRHFEEGEEGLRKTKEGLERLKASLFETAAGAASLRNETSRLRTLLGANERHQEKRNEVLKRLTEERRNLDKKKVSFQEEVIGVGQEFHSSEKEKETILKRLIELKANSDSLEKEIDKERAGFQEAASRLELIRELEETSQSLEQKLLASLAKDPLRSKLVKSLREVLEIEPGYESAVEAVLGALAQGLVAEDIETAKGLVAEMAKAHMGPCGILVKSEAKANGRSGKPLISHPLVKRRLEEVVKAKQGLQSLFEPLLEDVYVIEDFNPKVLHELLPLTQERRLVTKQGILLGPDSRIFFRNGRLSHDQGPFQRRAQMSELTKSRSELKEKIDSLETKQDCLREEILHLETERSTLEEKGHEVLIRRKSTESCLRGLSDRLAGLEEERRVVEFEMAESEREVTEMSQELVRVEEALLNCQKREAGFVADQKKLESAATALQAERETDIHNLARLRGQLENQEHRLEILEASTKLILTQIENSKDRATRLNAEAEELRVHAEETVTENAELERATQTLEREQTESEESLNQIRGRKAYQEEVLKQCAADVTERGNRVRELSERVHENELKNMELSYRERSIYERMEQSYATKLADLRAEDFTDSKLDKECLEKEIKAIKEKVEGFGPVNLLAVEEYEELKHRHDFLAGQEKDLNDAREALLEAIRRINRTTKTLFAETFQKAQTLFQEYYQTLFSGGHAELILLDEMEGREPGVDIMVRPPGKKLQHISLLSGGEKALMAMALLFALFRIRPSPLCVLDEVDAPLDEANVDRFIKVLRTFLASTQFLIVTHNRKTIAMGDCLYGVTMEESGISKIVSVRVTQTEPKAASSAEQGVVVGKE